MTCKFKNGAQLWGLFDGHGGTTTADFLVEHLQGEIERELQSGKSICTSLAAAFETTDCRLLPVLASNCDRSGSCAVVCVILDGVVVTANLGYVLIWVFNLHIIAAF